MYHTFRELADYCERNHVFLWEAVLKNEIRISHEPKELIYDRARRRLEIMESAVKKHIARPSEADGSYISGMSAKQHENKDNGICGAFINRVMAYALSCSEANASMGKVCAAPTAGSCGILPAVLIGLKEELALDEETVLNGFITAGGLGAIITHNATVSGAEGGCQAECGVAAAIAAAAAVQMCQGSVTQSIAASGFALTNVMGLVCDPVAGLVEIPCVKRNVLGCVNAISCADMAMAGIQSRIPPDEVIDAMQEVGCKMDSAFRETALGGLAATKTGQEIMHKLMESEEDGTITT